MSLDIGPILREWDKDTKSGRIRKIIGQDGREKIQLRIEFGMLQMEADGRPDGKRPYGKESFLEHYRSLIEMYKQEYGTDEGFKLDYHDCEKLRQESLQYYHRYVTLFDLGDYVRAERDTARNLRVLDMIKQYAETQDDALSFEIYRPYIIMMNARARAFILSDNNDYAGAIEILEEAMERINRFYIESGYRDDQISESKELEVLRNAVKEIRDSWENS